MLSRLQFALVLAATFSTGLQAQMDEYQVKAFFLCSFARYVEWPAHSFNSPSDPIVICVLGENPFGRSLDQAVAGRDLEGRRFVVRRISAVQRNRVCHILFVPSFESKRFRSGLKWLENSGTLTVGETPRFASEGGVINFKLEDGKVRFEIDVEAAKSQGLHIGSKLLNLAQVMRK